MTKRRLTIWVGVGLAVAVLQGGCADKQRVRMYGGPELPPTETSLVVVQPDRAGVMLRIEAVDGVRMPGADREFYDRDTGAIVRAGNRTIEVRGWVVAVGDAPLIDLGGGISAQHVTVVTLGPQSVNFSAAGGHEYVVRARRAAFDSEVRRVTLPLRPVHTQEWLMSIVDRKDIETECPECSN